MKKLVFIFCVVAVTSVQAQLKTSYTSFETTRIASEPIQTDYVEPYVEPVAYEDPIVYDAKIYSEPTKTLNKDGSTTVSYPDGSGATYSSTGETLYKTDSSGTIYYADGTISKTSDATKTVSNPDGTSVTYSSTGEVISKTDTEGNIYYADGSKSTLDSTAVKLSYEDPKLDSATAVSYDGAVKDDSYAISDAEVVSASTSPTLSSTTTSYAEPVRDSAVIGTTTAVNDGQIATAISDGEVAVSSGTSSTSVSSTSVTEVKDSAVIGTTTAVNDGQIATAYIDAEVATSSGTTTVSSGTTSTSGTSSTFYDSLVPTSWSDPVTSSSLQPVSIDLDGETSSYLCSRYNKCATTSTATSTTTSGTGGGTRLSLNMSNYSINAGVGLVPATDSATFSKAAVGIFQQVAWTGSGAPVVWSGTGTSSGTTSSSGVLTGDLIAPAPELMTTSDAIAVDSSLIKLSGTKTSLSEPAPADTTIITAYDDNGCFYNSTGQYVCK
jgi:hypothetical protein